MTEAIKQRIEKTSYKETGNPRNKLFYSMGLTKGIEIAEGFLLWAGTRYDYTISGWKEIPARAKAPAFTTSQLLEIYLKTLEP